MEWCDSPAWKKALGAAADPDRVRQRGGQLVAAGCEAFLREADEEQALILAALWSGSVALGDQLAAHPDWLEMLRPSHLVYPRRREGLRREVASWLRPAIDTKDYEGALARLRQFKRRETCRIATRDLARRSHAAEITRELSDLADVCLDTVLAVCVEQWSSRLGRPWHRNARERWEPTQFAVLGLGKLGGQELNYNSDVDVMFLYTEEGALFREPPRRGAVAGGGLSNHQFFKRLAEAFVAEVTRATPDGTLYRVDLRLRPEGESGPLCRSLSSCEHYYAQWGQTWERMMLIKARCVAGDCELAEEFLESIQSFRYPRHLSERVLREMAAMKERMEAEVVRWDELERNVKLGRGGIREIEFVAQTAQILNAGRQPFLQESQTLPTLQKLVQYRLLTEEESKDLTQAYLFFRDIEHRLQMEHHLQTHTIPADRADLERIGRLMGYTRVADFEKVRRHHADRVRGIYDRHLRWNGPEAPAGLPRDIERHQEAWKRILREHGFRDPDHSLRLLTAFVFGPGYIHVSTRTSELAWELVPPLLALCGKQDCSGARLEWDPTSKRLSDPDRVLARLDSFIDRYGARSVLFETWTHHPSYFELLLLLFDRSEFLAETALRTPDLVDELVLSGRLNRGKSADETLEDLRYGLQDADQFHWIRRYHEAELMRIGLRDILGLADFERNLTELSNLADACLQYALEVTMRKRRLRRPPFTIIGLGKLGGRELNFGSDLDIMFVAPSGEKHPAALAGLAVEVMDLISRRTERGLAFETDPRLRPDGEKGLLVNTLRAFEDYYRHRAQLWEIQSLSRTRPIAGDMALGGQFQRLTAALCNFSPTHVEAGFVADVPVESKDQKRRGGAGAAGNAKGLAAYTPDWKQRIAAMRVRIEKERTPAGQETLAIKTGAGGLIDVEFMAQVFCLERGWQEANTQRVLGRIQEENAMPAAEVERLIEHYRKLRRVEGILRRWSLEAESELPVEPEPYYRVAVRCGYATPDAFRRSLAMSRKEIRQIYDKFMPVPDRT